MCAFPIRCVFISPFTCFFSYGDSFRYPPPLSHTFLFENACECWGRGVGKGALLVTVLCPRFPHTDTNRRFVLSTPPFSERDASSRLPGVVRLSFTRALLCFPPSHFLRPLVSQKRYRRFDGAMVCWVRCTFCLLFCSYFCRHFLVSHRAVSFGTVNAQLLEVRPNAYESTHDARRSSGICPIRVAGGACAERSAGCRARPRFL
jgi:hypothetical protein